MLKEALEYVVGLKAPHFHKDGDDREFVDRKLEPVNVPLISPLAVSTLSGFCDLIDHGFEEFPAAEVLVQIENFGRVELIATASDEWSRRTVYAIAVLPDVGGFPFGQFVDHESFIIGLQANFTPTPDLDYLLRVASNLTSERVAVSEDDGVSQKVALRAGVVLKADSATVIKSRVTLAPFRTFRELDQPASDFILRLRDAKDTPPTLALFEADGGTWKLDAVETIGRFLRVRLDAKDVPIII